MFTICGENVYHFYPISFLWHFSLLRLRDLQTASCVCLTSLFSPFPQGWLCAATLTRSAATNPSYYLPHLQTSTAKTASGRRAGARLTRRIFSKVDSSRYPYQGFRDDGAGSIRTAGGIYAAVNKTLPQRKRRAMASAGKLSPR